MVVITKSHCTITQLLTLTTSDLLYKFAVGLLERIHLSLQVSDGATKVTIQLLNVMLLVEDGCQLGITRRQKIIGLTTRGEE